MSSYAVHDLPLFKIKCESLTPKRGRYKDVKVCDMAIGFDTETTSFYVGPDGTPEVFNYDKYEESRLKSSPYYNWYRDARKGALLYHWQCHIEDNYFSGRDTDSLRIFFQHLHRWADGARLIIYIQNLGFDFIFLLNCFEMTDKDTVFTRKSCDPIYVLLDKYQFEFRCSAHLTQKSLAKIGDDLGMEKLVGNLDYNVLRTPLTPINAEEAAYNRRDTEILIAMIHSYKAKYKHVYQIPLTQTGEVRVQLKKIFVKLKAFTDICWKLQPKNLVDMVWLLNAFSGGCVLDSEVYRDITIDAEKFEIMMKDISSSYPWVMISQPYPLTPFVACRDPELIKERMQDPGLTYIIEVRCKGVRTKVPCLFLSSSHIREGENLQLVNGRISEADSFEVTLTKPDYEIFRKCYDIDDIEMIKIKFSELKYLPAEFRRFLVQCYKDKTALKGKDPVNYAIGKMIINGCFGIQVQKDFRDDIVFDQEDPLFWHTEVMTEESFKKKLDEWLWVTDNRGKKVKRMHYTSIQCGVFVTAYARQNLWYAILGESKSGRFFNIDDVLYVDTDSVKMFRSPECQRVFDAYNSWVLEQHKAIAAELGISPEDLSPLDPDGVPRPIGIYAEDGQCSEFRMLGSKKYIYRQKGGKDDGKLKMTLAGVPKDAVYLLDDNIDNFREGFVFGCKRLHEAVKAGKCKSEKLIPYYLSDIPETTFPDGYKNKDRFGVCLMPSPYYLRSAEDDYSDPEEFIRILYNESQKAYLFRQRRLVKYAEEDTV